MNAARTKTMQRCLGLLREAGDESTTRMIFDYMHRLMDGESIPVEELHYRVAGGAH